MKLDTVLQQVMGNIYNMAEHAKYFHQKTASEQQGMDSYQALVQQVHTAVKDKNYAEALNAIDNAFITIDPALKSAVCALKFTTLLKCDVARAIAFAKEPKAHLPHFENTAASIILNKNGLPKEAYRFAVDVFSNMLSSSQGPTKPIIHNIIAKCYSRMNDWANAIAFEEKAIESGNMVIAARESKGVFTDTTVNGYKAILATYKAAYQSDWKEYEKTVLHLVNTYCMNNSGELARYAWAFCDNERITNKASLSQAARWIEKAIGIDPSVRNKATYAALLFKLDRREEAVPIAKDVLPLYDLTEEYPDVACRLRKEMQR